MGFGKNFVQFVYDFQGFEKVDEKSKVAFSNLVTLSKELELHLQEDDFIDLLAVQYEALTNEDLMELEAQRKDKCRQEEDEQTEEQKKYTTQKMTRGISLFREALLVLGGLGPECQTVQKSCSSHSEQSPVLPHHL